MTTIYVVTHGSYSDYGIEAMFSTEKMAQAYIERRNDSDLNKIEEYALDPVSNEWLEGKVKCWSVWFGIENADIYRIEENEYAPEDTQWTTTDRNDAIAFGTRVLADTQERAAKIAMERRAMWVANGSPRILYT